MFKCTINIIGKNSTTANRKGAAATPCSPSPKHSKLHIAECPIGVATEALYNSNPHDIASKEVEDASKIPEIIHNSMNGNSEGVKGKKSNQKILSRVRKQYIYRYLFIYIFIYLYL